MDDRIVNFPDIKDTNEKIDQLYDLWIKRQLKCLKVENNFRNEEENQNERIQNLERLIHMAHLQKRHFLDQNSSVDEVSIRESSQISKDLYQMLNKFNVSFQSSEFVGAVKEFHNQLKDKYLNLTKEVEDNMEKIDFLLNEMKEIGEEHSSRMQSIIQESELRCNTKR